jgi:hypothetical protein
MTLYAEREAEKNRTQICVCGHTWRIHSRKDGNCLGGTPDQPMECACEQFENEDMPARRIDAVG